jgi:hypothetical protein
MHDGGAFTPAKLKLHKSVMCHCYAVSVVQQIVSRTRNDSASSKAPKASGRDEKRSDEFHHRDESDQAAA